MKTDTHTHLLQAVLHDSFSIICTTFKNVSLTIIFEHFTDLNSLIIIVNLLHRSELCADGPGE